jgi:type I restriction enzyme M protein
MPHKNFIQKIGFEPKENTSGIYVKKYPLCGNYSIEIDLDKEKINYGSLIKTGAQTTLNFSQAENWVVLECVDRLLEKGYKPENITLEKVYPAGHGFSGRLDICVTDDDGTEYLLIECKTYGKEFDKAVARLYKDGGQLFTYFKFSNKADVIMLYASELNAGSIIHKCEIVKIEDDYRTGDVKDFYDKWNKLTKDNGVFDSWVNPYQFVSKALTPKLLEPIKQEDSSFIFNRFLEILRHNVVSDKPNAFNKIFTLFLCKIYDEKVNEGTDNELDFQWLEGIDDDVSFQLRLTDLYKNGMFEFLEKKVTDFSETEFENKFKSLDDNVKAALLTEFKKIRLEKNNEFAIKEVYDEKSFKENAKVVKEVVELLQGYKIRYSKKQQYLSDFFELLLTTGLKQESGQFFTPVPVAQFIIKSLPIDLILEEKLQKGEANNLLPFVMDYAAGSGHFLTETMHEIQRLIDKKDDKKYNPSTAKKIRNWKDDHFDWALDYVYGIEKDYRLVKVGKVGCYLHGDGLANVLHTDGLANFNHSDYKGKLRHTDQDFPSDNKQFEILVSNPPYSVSAFKNASREYYRENDFSLYERLTDNSSEIECLFIERTKQLLKDGGVAGIILPSSILSNTGIYTKSREIILQYFDIVAIAELGSNTFMATGTNTVTLFLRRKSNYESINLKIAVDKFFTNLRDITLNGIESPVTKYVEHVWESILLEDYITLLQKIPNKVILEHEIFIEYKKKIKAKNEKEFWGLLLEKEQEKLYYFIIALPQKVVLVKSGEKDEEKRFLGYEFSYRRGSEGIHAMQRGKNIEDCTTLFDPDVFDNPTKASTYIYKAYNGDFDFPIDESLLQNVARHNLVDLIVFDRPEFEKGISLNEKKKIKYETIWNTNKLELLGDIGEIKKGTSITKEKTNEGLIPVIGGGQEAAYFHNKSNRAGNVITISASGAYAGFVNYFKMPIFASDCNTIISKDESVVSTKLIYLFLKSIQNEVYTLQRGQAQPHVYGDDLSNIKIPLVSGDIQQKILSEIEELEKNEEKANANLLKLKTEINTIIDSANGTLVKLQEVTSKIGSGATPKGGESAYIETGITLIRSQNIYDNEFYKEGLVFIDEDQAKKLIGVTVEENDILFNITGASVARCCIVEKTYLPARVNQHVAIIRTNKKALPKYVEQILISDKYKSELLSLAESSSTREAITKAQLEEFKIPLISLPEQQLIVTQVETLEIKKAKLEKEIASIPQKKDFVLKKYLQ